MKGSELAKKLNISTSALKHYEAWGIVPPVEREENGYRNYKKEHEYYFSCIVTLNRGFGMDVVRKVMPLIIKGEYVQGLWLITKAQMELHEKRMAAEKTLKLLTIDDVTVVGKIAIPSQELPIGKLAKETTIPPSTLRHWEKEGLLTPRRHQQNGFRMYTYSDLKKALVINNLQKVVYSIEIVREILSEYDTNDLQHTKKIVAAVMKQFDNRLVEQMRGIAALSSLLEVLEKGKRSSLKC